MDNWTDPLDKWDSPPKADPLDKWDMPAAVTVPKAASLPSDSLEIPRGLTSDQVQYLSTPTAQDFSGNQVPVKDLGWAAKAGHGMANTLERTGLGVTQMVNDAVGTPEKASQLKSDAVAMKARQAPIENTTAGMLGGLAPSLVVPGTIAKAIAGGLVLGGLEPETGELAKKGSITRGMQDVIGERATNAIQGGGMMGLGGAVGKLIGGVTNRLPFIGSPARGGAAATEQDVLRASSVKDAEDLGMQVDVSGRTGGGTAKSIRSVFRSLPFTGRIQKGFDENNISRANQVLANQFGSDARVLTDDVFMKARSDIGDEFDKYVKANARIDVDGEYMSAMKDLKRQVNLLPEGQRDPEMVNIIRDYYEPVAPVWKTGKVYIDAERYKEARSSLGTKARMAGRAGNDKLAGRIDQVIHAMDDMAERSVPKAEQDAYRNARKQWQGLRIAEDSVDQSGNVVRTKLKSSVLRAMPRSDRGQRTGGPEIYDKLNRAMEVVTDNVPNSGTPQRIAAAAILGAPSLAFTGIPGIGQDSSPWDYLKGAGVPLITQAAMLNPYTARLITRQLGPRQISITKALQRAGGVGAYGAMQQSQQ